MVFCAFYIIYVRIRGFDSRVVEHELLANTITHMCALKSTKLERIDIHFNDEILNPLHNMLFQVGADNPTRRTSTRYSWTRPPRKPVNQQPCSAFLLTFYAHSSALVKTHDKIRERLGRHVQRQARAGKVALPDPLGLIPAISLPASAILKLPRLLRAKRATGSQPPVHSPEPTNHMYTACYKTWRCGAGLFPRSVREKRVVFPS